MIANTITTNNLTSLLVPSQLPEFIRDDPAYSNFVLFLQAYYEWMEVNGNVTEQTKNLLKYKDIDQTTTEFIQYFYNDFLSYFPPDILASKVEVVKLAKQLYQAKGTPSSYKLLFRILYNSDVDFLNTGDVTLKASSGSWYVTKSIKLATDVMYVSGISYSGNIITIITVVPHYLSVGDTTVVSAVSGTNAPNGTWVVSEINSLTSYSFVSSSTPSGVLDISNASVYFPHGYVNENFLNTISLRIFGETSQTIATVENVVQTGIRMEVFLSNIERLFVSGEYVRIVDNHNNDVLFDGHPLRAKILGQISQIKIDPKHEGSKYVAANTTTGYVGDPVVVFGGLNTPTGHGATAKVGSVTSGSIQKITIVSGGYGYANNQTISTPGQANTMINISASSGGAIAHAGDIGQTNSTTSTLTYIPIDNLPISGQPGTIFDYNTIQIGAAQYAQMFANNYNANANTTLANAFTFTSYNTGYLASVVVDNGGGGIDPSNPPTVTAESVYETNVTRANGSSLVLANIVNMGILAPIQIISGGTGYVNNDVIVISGGTGYGAKAKVTNVASNGCITSVSYTANGIISLGGNGYSVGDIYPTQNTADANVVNSIIQTGGYKLSSGLPMLSVTSANTYAANAVLVVPGILGSGALLNPIYNGVGNITEISISDYGEDYTSVPSISLKVQDILVNGLLGTDVSYQPQNGDIVYQGNSINTAPYIAHVDSIYPLITNTGSPQNNTYLLRVYNYTSNPSSGQQFKIDGKSISMGLVTSLTDQQIAAIELGGGFTGLNFTKFNNLIAPGVLSYGDGLAKATATFLNGLTIGNGQYLDSTGQPSSFNVLQNENYNDFTYQITLDKEIAKYRSTLLNLLHPTGTKVIGRYSMKSSHATDFHIINVLNTGYPLSHYTGSQTSGITMSANFTNQSNNIIHFTNLYGANLANILSTNNIISITTANGDVVSSRVTSTNAPANNITIASNVWLAFANVANITANANSTLIHVTSLTGSYDIINNGIYTNANTPLLDIVRPGDSILVANTIIKTVTGVTSNTITVSSNVSTNSVNSLMSVSRTLTATDGGVLIFGPVGQQYYPELTTESGNTIISQDGSFLILG